MIRGYCAQMLHDPYNVGWTRGRKCSILAAIAWQQGRILVAATPGRPAVLGVSADDAIREVGWDTDCDETLRAAVEAASGSELLDEDGDDVVDVVLLWWRSDDGDLVDALVDAIALLADHGSVWLLSPKPGRPGHVEVTDIAEAAPIAGLAQTSTISAAPDWQGTRLVSPRSKR